jgi:TonB-linked SusC/RagA family outer membrane protein
MKTNTLFKLLMVFTLLIFSFGFVMAQNVTVTGKVTSADDGTPIPGASVVQKGTTKGVLTDMNGAYQIAATKGATLVFSFTGMQTQEVVLQDQTTINVVLAYSTTMMDEIVVTALGITREKKSLGYAITEVSGSDIARAKDLNVVNSLSGRVAGLVITQGTFGPGSSSRIVIRGNHSITGNNQPLYVVDGVPYDDSGYGSANDNDAGEYSKSDYGSGISDLNPDDIESMSVLKGPNAAALYGSRAANGVILITTKKGSVNRGLGVTYSSNITFETPLLIPKFQNEYGQGTGGNIPSPLTDLLKEGGSWGPKMDGTQQLYWTGETKAYSPQPDNVKDFFKVGSTFMNTLAFDGGNDKSSFRFSYSNTKANSILPGSDLTRHNFNLRSVFNLTSKLCVDAKVTYFLQDSHNRPMMGTEGVMANLYSIPRNVPIKDLEDYQNADYSVRTYSSQSVGNPYWVMKHDINDETRSRIQGYAKATYTFNRMLSAFVRIGTDASHEKIENVYQYGHWYYPQGTLNFTMTNNSETNIDALIMFNKDITQAINLSLNLGANHMYASYDQMYDHGENFKIPTKATLESAATVNAYYTPLQEKNINSVYGFATISYNGMLFLETSMRNDWSSTLPKSNWSYFYPSVSLSGLLDKVLNMPSVDLAKLRVSWAKVGSDTGPYQLLNSYYISSSGDSYLGHTILNSSSTLNNENLKPEQTSSLEFGGEFRFFGNRLYTDMSYYSITSEDLIMDVNIPSSTGYSKYHTNVGKMTNKGFEILLGGIPVQTKDFSWDISVNLSTNKNKLISLIEGTDTEPLSTSNSGAVTVQATAGGGYGDIYTTYLERNSDGKPVVDTNGRFKTDAGLKYMGNYQPKWVGGITNTISYKSVSLRFLIDARIGGKIYSGTDAGLDNAGVSANSLKYRDGGVIIDGVFSDGTKNNKSISGQEYWQTYSSVGEGYVYDQTNVRLRELTLTYELPKSLIDKTFIKGATFGLTGRNLFFIYRALDNYDPESSFSVSNYAQGVLFYNMPTTRSIGFNISVKF